MKPPQDAAAAAMAWWSEYRPDPEARQVGDRMAFARLRRCATVAEAMQEVAAIQLFRRLGGTGPADLPGAALTAAVLAHVRKDVPGGRVARLVGPGTIDTPDTALLKPLRFRRLMETTDWDDRLVAFRRLAALAKGELPVADLARALLFWTDAARRCWVLDYWNALPPQPAQAPAAEPKAAEPKKEPVP